MGRSSCAAMLPLRYRLARAAAFSLAAALALTLSWSAYRGGAGDPAARLEDRWHEGQRVLDRRGRDLRDIPSDSGHRGQDLALDAMGERIVLATLAGEDRDFFEHHGVDATAIVRAIGQNVRHARLVSGASTITQQLVKLLDHQGEPHERTVGEKIKEAARAQNLEHALDKRAILEAYLNRLPYGHGLTGPEAAAQAYFGVSARDLSWAQATYLSVLPRAPSSLDPYDHPERGRLRQRALLDALRDHGVLSEADHARAVAEEIAPRPLSRPFLAPHFVQALRDEGALSPTGTTRTTLDEALQRDVEGLTRTHLAALRDLGASNAAILVIDNANGDVLAYVGSADFNDAAISGQVDMIRALRQPGSTLKPFVYALSFARGRTAAEPLPDVPTRFAERDGAYAPTNFDGTFEGPISAREALAGSLNVPAVRLAAELTPAVLLGALHDLGFDSLDRDAGHYGLSLALGSGEVTLRELAAAYVTLARGGHRIPLRVVLGEEGAPAPSPDEGAPIFEPGVAALVTDALSDPLARVRGLHGMGPFDLGFPVAVKTGTSSGYRDTWSVGYTRERTVAVWLGNAAGAPTLGLTGASGAGPLFADVMRRAMADVPARAPLWDRDLLDEAEVCPLSGRPAGPACPGHVTRRFVHGHVPTASCDVHVFASPVPGPRAGPSTAGVPLRCDPGGPLRIAAWPAEYDEWLAARRPGAPGQDPFGTPWIPRSALSGCGDAPQAAPELRVDAPAPGSVFPRSLRGDAEAEAIFVSATFAGDAIMAQRVREVEFVVDGRVAARSERPFRAALPATPGDHDLVVRPADPALAVRLGTTRFSVR